MFSGNYNCRKDAEGRYFIDRDGTHFRYILNFLRDGTFNFPPALRDELLAEARFYQIVELIAYLEGKGNHYAAHQLSAKAMEGVAQPQGTRYHRTERVCFVFSSCPLPSPFIFFCLNRSLLTQILRHLLTEFERQAGAGILNPVVAIYSTENSKLYRDASDPDIRNIVISDLQSLGFKVRSLVIHCLIIGSIKKVNITIYFLISTLIHNIKEDEKEKKL